MKKKITGLLLVFLLVLCLAGCGKNESDGVEYNQAELESYAEYMISNFQAMTETDVQSFKDMSDMELQLMMLQYGLPMTGEDFIGMLDSWFAGVNECGEFQEYGSFELKTTSDGPVLMADAVYADRNAQLQFTFNDKMKMETLTVNARYSLGEILTKAGLNTVLGMGTVFVVLIFISFIISLFKYIPAIQDKFSKKKSAPARTAADTLPVEKQVPETDDGELIAVIAAAIAAAEGTTTDGFVVRSIKRRTSNKWN